MKFHSHWQPLRNEDAFTALVFGFLRHVPTELALDRWLSDALDRPVVGQALDPKSSFWPRYPSGDDGRVFTEPDMVIQADDGHPLVVVVEVKPAYGQHTAEQLVREALDAARNRPPARVAVVLIGADRGAPTELAEWEGRARDMLDADGLTDVEIEFRYSSWARLARAIKQAAPTPEDPWVRYAEDVLFKLHAKGVLDYDGAPVIDDLNGLTLSNAVEVFHRITRTFRLLALSVDNEPQLRELGLKPFAGRYTLLRDGSSSVLPGNPEGFETTVLLVPYAAPGWPNGCGVFFGLRLAGDDGPRLEVGAFNIDRGPGELPWEFAHAIRGGHRTEHLAAKDLQSAYGGTLDVLGASKNAEWVYAERVWRPGVGDADVDWIVEGLTAATRAWEDRPFNEFGLGFETKPFNPQ